MWIQTGTFAGSGYIPVDSDEGRDDGPGEDGGGSGGRIASDYTSSTFSGRLTAAGGGRNPPGGGRAPSTSNLWVNHGSTTKGMTASQPFCSEGTTASTRSNSPSAGT
jgi:hypothetical protein